MRLILRLALGSLASHRGKTALVGSILAAGAALVMVGLALLEGVEAAMRASITGSVAADLQVYDRRAPDELILLGSSFIGAPDVGRIDHFERVSPVLAAVPGVEAVVPMGTELGALTTKGPIDRRLEALRAEAGGSADRDRLSQLAAELRGLLAELGEELEAEKRIADDPQRIDDKLRVVADVLAGDSLERLADPPGEGLDALEMRIGPLDDGGRQFIFRFLGTDPGRYAEHFPGFRVVLGQAIPSGKRGFLFSHRFYESQVKHPVARGLDVLMENAEQGMRIADDPGQQARVRRLARQWRRVAQDLDPSEAAEVTEGLAAHLGQDDRELPALLEAFLTVDDSTLEPRHALFYALIAPRIRLFELEPGDTLTLRSFTKSGFVRAVNVPFVGTFELRGLEASDLAGVYQVTDLVTFRELHGVMSAEQQAELSALRARVGLSDLDPDEAEDKLFGGEGPLVVSEPIRPETAEPVAAAPRFSGPSTRGLPLEYPASALTGGLVTSAAIRFSPGADPERTRAAIEAAIEREGLELRTATWQDVSGLIGQFVIVVRLVLYVALVVIFLVAAVIVNNALVMATMERVNEIGTLRAIGAHRRTVLGMVFAEALMLGLAAGLLGAAIGAAVVAAFGAFGLPAPNRELRFLFGGPALYPEVSVGHALVAVFAALSVAGISAAYPAALGASVPPVVAMRTEE